MFNDVFQRYKAANMVMRFIYINIAVYIFVVLIGVFSVLFNAADIAGNATRILELPSSLTTLMVRPWTMLTYMFLHEHFMHILWNMFALYFFGRLFLEFYSLRHFVGMYILGGIFGGVTFVLAYNAFPYFAPYVSTSYLVGASASVLAIVVAAAVRAPQYRVNMLFIGSIKLSTFALVTVAISVFMLSGSNAGGNFAHIGGAFSGWLMAFMLGKGVDLTLLVNKPIDWVSALFDKKTWVRKKKTKFTYTKTGRSSDYEYNARKKATEAQIDKILEKIKKGGYASLTDEEKKQLFDASSK